MSDKLNIEQLIRSRLGEAEITPSSGAWKGVYRKLRWKQFWRFNPGKANIHYLAGLVIVGAGSIVLLTRNVQEVVAAPDSIDPGSSYRETKPDQGKVQPVERAEEVKVEERQKTYGAEPQKIDPEQKVSKPAVEAVNKNSDPSTEVVENIPENENPSSQINDQQAQNRVESYFTSSAQSGCAPLSVQFFDQSINATSISWIIGRVEGLTTKDPLYTFYEAGTYHVTLTAENSMGQSSVCHQIIEVYPAPGAEFELEEGFEEIGGHLSLRSVNYTRGATSWSWNLLEKDNVNTNKWVSNEFQPSIKLTDLQESTKKVQLVAINEFGCTDTSRQQLPDIVEHTRTRIKFPTAFSPSPLGPVGSSFSPHEKRTDLFHPIFEEVPVEYSLKIYTRRGQVIFETRNIYEGWDGYFHQERSSGGVYVWVVEGTWEYGEEFKLHGDVTLIWNELW
ncbi:MAG: PKD domain-containing protein [Bacteroidota bacterium]